MQVKINPGITSLKESSTLVINQGAIGLRKQGKDIVHFGFGQSPFEVHSSVQDALKAHSFRKEYLPTKGLLELRQEVCNFYKSHYSSDFDPENIIIGPGSKELIFQALFVLEGKLIIPAPSWVSYGPQAHIRGKNIISILTKRENGYKLTAVELKNLCSDLDSAEQKIIIMNSPNNPSGAVYNEKEIKDLVEVFKAENIVVISDEIYSLVQYSKGQYQSFYKFYPEGTVVTSGLSKGFSAGGYRLGFLACGEAMSPLITALAAMVSETFSAVSAPTQYAAITAFEYGEELKEYTVACTDIHRACGAYLARGFRSIGLNCVEPDGGFYLFPDFENYKDLLKSKGIEDAESLCKLLLEECGLACLPSSDFYFPKSYLAVRVASVDYDGGQVHQASLKYDKLDDEFIEKECPNLPKGIERLRDFLKR